MFESLSDKLESAFKKLRGHGKLTEGNIEEGLKDVRLALLEADVHYRVVKSFIEEVRTRVLREQLSEWVIALSGADFSAPMVGRAEPEDFVAHLEPRAKRPAARRPGRADRRRSAGP